MGLTGVVGQLPLANLVINVSAETKNSIRQMQDLHRQTKKSSKGAKGSMAVGLRAVVLASAAIAAIVSGIGVAGLAVYGMLRASSYYAVYSRLWANEATMISNEWVRRQKGKFDKITSVLESIRVEYTKSKDSSLVGSIMTVLFGEARSAGTGIITKGMTFLSSISAGYNNLVLYMQLWVTKYIMPIYNFIDSILSMVNTIYDLINDFIDSVWRALSILPGI